MIDREQTAARLTRILDVLREDLADESNDDRRSLENTERHISRLVTALNDTSDAAELVTGVTVLLDLLMGDAGVQDGSKRDYCPVCEGCTHAGCIVTALDASHACKCPPKTAPVPAQTIGH